MSGYAMLVPVFSVTLFLSAMLLFWVEPMFGKMILPLLGGTPAIWNTAMLFYQTALLAGYGYAHLSSRWLSPGRQAAVHLALMLVALSVLPIAIPAGWTPPTDGNPVFWLLLLLVVAVGGPFVVLSATTPMVQRWFAASGHRDAGNPYFLYAVSNAGSFVALLAYPVALEPNQTLADQSRAWSGGFVVLLLLVAATARLGRGLPIQETRAASSAELEGPDWRRRLHWITLAFAPSSLMLGVTNFISTDIAAIPLLWIVPLALYLLTFVIAFSVRPWPSPRFVGWFQPFLIPWVCFALIPVLSHWNGTPWQFVPLHLAVFFVSALVCHFELARLRPTASRLTEYYLLLSFGGMLGGVFNALLAPVLFNDLYEYPIVLSLACLLRPWPEGRKWPQWPMIAAAVTGGVLVGVVEALGRPDQDSTAFQLIAIMGLLSVATFLLFTTRGHPLAFGTAVGLFLLAVAVGPATAPMLYAERNFFGVIQVRDGADHQLRLLEHGVTVHGTEALDLRYQLEPLSYYSRYGGLGEALAAIGRRQAAPHIAVVGLGTGSLACHGTASWHFTFFEIDPSVARVANDPKLFSFLARCPGRHDIVLGDGRLSLRRAPANRFDAVIIDAFSSDAIPIHLLTREAIRLYQEKLAPNGLIVLHLSNRYLNLPPVAAAAARDLGLMAMLRVAPAGVVPNTALPYYASVVVALGRQPQDFDSLASADGWQVLTAPAALVSWSDDYSNLFRALAVH